MFNFNFDGTTTFFDEVSACFRCDDKVRKFKTDIVKNTDKTIYLKLNSNCNLRCVYCFQTHDCKSIIKQDISEFDILLKKLITENQNIILFGGEPFIEENIKNITHIFDLLDNKKVYIFTNGCYDNKFSNFIYQNKSKINSMTISIDGVEEIHNKRRVLKDGNSFQKIIQNAKELLANGITFLLQINIDKDNYDRIDELFQYLDLTFGIDNITITLNKVLHSDRSIEEIDLLKKYLEIKKLYPKSKIILNSKLYTNLSRLFKNNGFDLARCDIGNIYVLDFMNQQIYSCPECENTNIGYFDKTNMYISEDKRQKYLNYSRKKNSKCSECSYINYCKFGCIVEKDCSKLNCKEETRIEMQFILDNFRDFFMHK